MIEIILISIFTFLAFCGGIHIIMEIATNVPRRHREDLECAYTVITVKDRESDVERIIRAAAWRQLRLGRGGVVPEIYAVDLGSCDGTYEILERLACEYNFLRALRKDEYIGAFSDGKIRGND